MHTPRPYCLSVAGFDPCGGAGILSDSKTFECLQVTGLGIVSALTIQNDSEFISVKWNHLDHIRQQIEIVKKYPVTAAKIGLLKNFEQLQQTAILLKQTFPGIFIVWDPICKASAGFSFHSKTAIPDSVASVIDLITPNFNEYIRLGMERTHLQTAVLLKGGHRPEQKGTDTLYHKDKSYDIQGTVFTNKKDKHGTGCVLSAAITAFIAKGDSLPDACKKAKNYVENFMQSNNSKLGYHL